MRSNPHKASDVPQHDGCGANDGADPLEVMAGQFKALLAFVEHYLAAKQDRVRAGAVNVALYMVLACAGLVFAIAATVIALTYLFRGVSGGLGALFGLAWLGDLLAGLLVLGGMAAAVGVFVVRYKTKRLTEKRREYEQRKALERRSVGEDTDELACRAD